MLIPTYFYFDIKIQKEKYALYLRSSIEYVQYTKDIIVRHFQNGCHLNGKYVLSLKCHHHVICENISSKFSKILLHSYYFTWLAMISLLQFSETS